MALRFLIIGSTILVVLTWQVWSQCIVTDDNCPNPDVNFWLYTRAIRERPYLMTDRTLARAPLVDGAPLIVLIHGYTGYRDYSPNMELRPAYLSQGDYNLVSVDYGSLVKAPCYVTAVLNLPKVARCIAAFLRFLYQNRGWEWWPLTRIVGFSLGAHVAGLTGQNLPGIPRITGVDPALPLFTDYITPVNMRLSADDAVFVDVYHSNTGWRGQFSESGHVDFYINNGAYQPGCGTNSSCDHVRGVEVFAESIATLDGFYGTPCTLAIGSFIVGITPDVCYSSDDNIVVLAGEHVDTRVRGAYRIKTNNAPPYAMGRPDQTANN